MKSGDPKSFLDALNEHVDSCAECGDDPPRADVLARALHKESIAIDPSRLSALAMAQAAPELAERAQVVFRRQLKVVLLLALVPLPGMLVWGVYALQIAFEAVAGILPAGLAAYLVVSYGLAGLVVLTASYAAIPLLLDRLRGAQAIAGLEVSTAEV